MITAAIRPFLILYGAFMCRLLMTARALLSSFPYHRNVFSPRDQISTTAKYRSYGWPNKKVLTREIENPIFFEIKRPSNILQTSRFSIAGMRGGAEGWKAVLREVYGAEVSYDV